MPQKRSSAEQHGILIALPGHRLSFLLLIHFHRRSVLNFCDTLRSRWMWFMRTLRFSAVSTLNGRHKKFYSAPTSHPQSPAKHHEFVTSPQGPKCGAVGICCMWWIFRCNWGHSNEPLRTFQCKCSQTGVKWITVQLYHGISLVLIAFLPPWILGILYFNVNKQKICFRFAQK